MWRRTPVQEFTQDSSQGHSGSSFYEEEEDKKSSDKEKEIIIAKTRPRVDGGQEEQIGLFVGLFIGGEQDIQWEKHAKGEQHSQKEQCGQKKQYAEDYPPGCFICLPTWTLVRG